MKTKALIIDDSEGSRKIVSYFFAKRSYQIIEACNGEEGIPHLLNHEDLNIVVLDWMMPNLNGSQMIQLSDAVLDEIQRLNSQQRLREKIDIVLYTSVKYEDIILPAMRNFNLSGYIHKGWSLDHQKRKFNWLLRNLTNRREAA